MATYTEEVTHPARHAPVAPTGPRATAHGRPRVFTWLTKFCVTEYAGAAVMANFPKLWRSLYRISAPSGTLYVASPNDAHGVPRANARNVWRFR